MARPGQTEGPKDDIPWYMRYGAQALGIVGAFCKYRHFCRMFLAVCFLGSLMAKSRRKSDALIEMEMFRR